jgi:pimeloyl-ACP methyl ester carboxylesterase
LPKLSMLASAWLIIAAAPATAAAVESAIYTDPPHDAAHPARMEVLHIPSHGVVFNGVAYLAAGAGVHPTLVLMHGLPGNEKNLDLAQAVRRAGWNVITFNYRGSWGSPGKFSFAGNLQDARSVLAFIRSPANASRFGIDTSRLVLAGHSMGGWVTAMTAEHDPGIAGTIIICGANMGRMGESHAATLAVMADNMESLAGVTSESMAAEVEQNASAFDWTSGAAGLARHPLLVLTANDGLAPVDDALARSVKAIAGARVEVDHAATDHSWSDARIQLEDEVIRWLRKLPTRS